MRVFAPCVPASNGHWCFNLCQLTTEGARAPWPFEFPLWAACSSPFSYFKNWVISLLLNHRISLYVLGATYLSHINTYSDSSSLCDLLFIFLMCWMSKHCVVWVSTIYPCFLRMSHLCPTQKTFAHCQGAKYSSFRLLCFFFPLWLDCIILTLNLMAHFKWMLYVCTAWDGVQIFLPLKKYIHPESPNQLLKRFSFLCWVTKSLHCRCVGLFLDSLFCT